MSKINLFEQLQSWAVTAERVELTGSSLSRLGPHATLARKNVDQVDVFSFMYDSSGNKIAGFVVAPKNFVGRLPVIIFNRGGTSDFGIVRTGRLFTDIAQLSLYGYIIIGTQYPGNSLSEGHDERGGLTDIESVTKLHELIEHLSCADAMNIGMYGESRGGMMTYLCMKEVDWIKTALIVGGLVDLDSSLRHRPVMAEVYEKHFGNTADERHKRSVVYWAKQLDKTSTLCILHGMDDDRVKVDDPLRLASELKNINYQFSLHLFQGGDHILGNVGAEKDIIIQRWFDRHLKEMK